MKRKGKFPSRDNVNHAFHQLHEQITRITVAEEDEMVKAELTVKEQ